MRQGTPDRPLHLAVAGSCVSRDAVHNLDPASHELHCYVARQSLLSWGVDAAAHLPEAVTFSNGFQEKQIRGDFAGDLTDRLDPVSGELDVLLVDLCDERHGVMRLPDGGYMTRSIDAVGNDGLKEVLEGAQHLELGSAPHLHAWKHSADRFAAWLDSVGLRDRTLVVAVPWAVRSNTGTHVPSSMGMTPQEANRRYAPYLEHLGSLGLMSVSVADPVADEGHRWGLAPFHYSREVYDVIGGAIDDLVGAVGHRASSGH